jgi:hypothetical protein
VTQGASNRAFGGSKYFLRVYLRRALSSQGCAPLSFVLVLPVSFFCSVSLRICWVLVERFIGWDTASQFAKRKGTTVSYGASVSPLPNPQSSRGPNFPPVAQPGSNLLHHLISSMRLFPFVFQSKSRDRFFFLCGLVWTLEEALGSVEGCSARCSASLRPSLLGLTSVSSREP